MLASRLIDPRMKINFNDCLSILKEELNNQNRYLHELSKNQFKHRQDKYLQSKFVRDIILLNRKA